MICRLVLLFFLFSSIESKEPLKILVYNTKFGHSHSVFLGNIADILSEEGHNVVSLLEYTNIYTYNRDSIYLWLIVFITIFMKPQSSIKYIDTYILQI